MREHRGVAYGAKMPSLLTKVRTKVVTLALPVIVRPDADRTDLVRLGSDYGGWWVPTGLLNAGSICYCGGVGTDISFDLALVRSFGCAVWGIDPTPGSAEWVAAQGDLESGFTFVPLGVAGQNGTLRFYAPGDPSHISHSVKNIQGTNTYFEAEVVTIRELMKRLGHDRVDLVKLDVEGAEHETIAEMLDDGIRPKVLCVEYDQPEPISWGLGTTKRLRAAGYDLVKIDGLNLTFVLRDATR